LSPAKTSSLIHSSSSSDTSFSPQGSNFLGICSTRSQNI
jgi:hypothetical protein